MHRLNECSVDDEHDPHRLLKNISGVPDINFFWKNDKNGKRRLFGNPNKPSRALQKLFERYIKNGINDLPKECIGLKRLPSSTAFVKGSNHLLNAQVHQSGKFFYVTDLTAAYPSLNLEKLAVLIVYIKKYDQYCVDFSFKKIAHGYGFEDIVSDALYEKVLAFLQSFCSGIHGKGIAVGGVISPYLMNLFCEAHLDFPLRYLCKVHGMTYTRYADDLVFSREDKPIHRDLRNEIRECITKSSFRVNHRKSKVLSKEMGTIFVTRVGLRYQEAGDSDTIKSIIVFPKRKRRKLHGIIKSYLKRQMDWPEKVSGYVAEFIYYYKNVGKPTASDLKTFGLCKAFESEWENYRNI